MALTKITRTGITDNAVNVDKINDSAVERAKIKADAIDATKLADNAVSEEHLDKTVITGNTELSASADPSDVLLIYDADADALKKITAGNIAGASVSRTGTGDGSTTTFTVTSGVTVANTMVFINGVHQRPTTDYTISGTTLTFGTAPAASDRIDVRELPA